MREPLPPQYDPRETERRLYDRWVEAGVFHADPASGRDPYVVVIPPPNVTAVLHMGHGLNNTIQDVLVRWQRMRGREALWVPGTDHAGIATQNVVERQLAAEGRSRYDLGREAFVERVWEWVGETGGSILDQLKAIGASADWDRTRFTFDPGLSAAVREVFVRLHEKGLVYRGEYIINWCPRCLTALSNEEVEHEESEGKIYRLRYPLAGSDESIVVATTRPETMLGDTAVAVSPTDERYAHLVGREVELPLVGRRIPIVADDFVDPEFGTGLVKVTPAHDPNDFQIGLRHDLPRVNVMNADATLGSGAPERFRGLDRWEARARVVDEMRDAGLLDGVETHTHSVGSCYRCNTVVEPRLSDQWFVRMQPLAEPAIAAVREGEVRFTPERWTKVYFDWMENIQDWCISRQIWWGHRIPAWYGPDGTPFVARSEEAAAEAAREHYGEAVALEQDPDVLDTWFSSWLWPFSVFGWPEETEDLKRFYPTDTLVTGPDIIFFWVARMIMAGLEFRGEVPFREVCLNGIVRDHLGRKMSKSLGNGIDPLEVVERFGADALRYAVVSGAAPGTDIYLNPDDLEESFAPGRNFANKVWNIARFSLMHLEDEVPALEDVEGSLELEDRWILSRLARATAEVDAALARFRLHDASAAAHRFLWGELADWYLEIVKSRLYGDAGDESRDAARAALHLALSGGLRLLHPIMPFITEEVWQRMPRRSGEPDSVVVAPWPEGLERWTGDDEEVALAVFRDVVGAVRNIRGEYGVDPARRVPLRLAGGSPATREALGRLDQPLRALARLESVEDGLVEGEVGASAVLPSGVEVFVPLADVIDLDRERARLQGEVERLEGQLRGTEGKLANERFVSKAPSEVVEREREKLGSFRDQLEKVREKLAVLQGVG
jgi:valyl-tRNA synthetase